MGLVKTKTQRELDYIKSLQAAKDKYITDMKNDLIDALEKADIFRDRLNMMSEAYDVLKKDYDELKRDGYKKSESSEKNDRPYNYTSVERALITLGLDPGERNRQVINDTAKKIRKLLHPDQYAVNNESVRNFVEERYKEFIAAYDVLKKEMHL